MIDPKEKAETAGALFRGGYNCAQAAALAFCAEAQLERDDMARVLSAFGGGVGRLREMCGALSGAVAALGAVTGGCGPGEHERKARLYELTQQLANDFKRRNGSYICRELLSGVSTTAGSVPEKRTEQYYKKRPCEQLVRESAAALAVLLNELSQTDGAADSGEKATDIAAE